MSKYTYTRVEHLSDLDITGNTQYYLFEEGVGHKEFEKEKMKRCSLYGLESYIKERTIFTREEKPWYQRIPKNGILCKNRWSGKGYRLIVSYDEEDYLVYDEDDNHYDASCMKPLSNQEIRQFLQEEG